MRYEIVEERALENTFGNALYVSLFQYACINTIIILHAAKGCPIFGHQNGLLNK
jgi:hypothetical protein